MSKEKRPIERPKYDTQLLPTEVEPGRLLSLPVAFKEYLMDNGLDFRFLNAQQFRSNGNFHKSQWVPFVFRPEMGDLGLTGGVTAEGYIQRKDLILGVRTKALTAKYRELKEKRNKQLANHAQSQRKDLQEQIQRSSLSGQVKVVEGYED